MASQGVIPIKSGSFAGVPIVITAADAPYGDPISDFDVIWVTIIDPAETTLAESKIRFRRSGQPSFDTAYISYNLSDAIEVYNAANTYIPGTHRMQQGHFEIHNVGLAAPAFLRGGQLATSFGRFTFGHHNHAEVIDAIELSLGVYGTFDYEVSGILKGKSEIIKVIDLSAPAFPYLIETADSGKTLDKFEMIRFCGVDRVPSTGSGIYAQVREQGGSIIGAGQYTQNYFQVSGEGNITNRDGHEIGAGLFTQHILHNFGLEGQTFGKGAYYGGTSAETIFDTTDVDSAEIHDAINLTTAATFTAGNIYITGITK